MDISAGLSNLSTEIRDLLTGSFVSSSRELNRTNVPILQQQRRSTKAAVDQLLELYRSGVTIQQLCSDWNINRDTVYEHLHRAGIIPNRLNKLRPVELQTARELYSSGLTLATVGDRLGVDAKTVRTALAQAGVTIRPRRGWRA